MSIIDMTLGTDTYNPRTRSLEKKRAESFYIPGGGLSGQILTKSSDTHRDVTWTTLDAGIIDTDYYTQVQLDAGQLDNRYYTETELDAGKLDNRYYTEAEVDALIAGGATGVDSDSWTINQDQDDVTVSLVFDRTSGGAATLQWDGATVYLDKDMAFNGHLALSATERLYLDGAAGHTYISENSNDNLRWVVGGTVQMESTVTYSKFANKLFVNETANAKMTIGLTVNQGANDNEILAFKSSDVAHGVTDETETDTFGFMKKASPGNAGLEITGISETYVGVQITGCSTTPGVDPTAANAAIILNAVEKSGAGYAAMTANSVLVSIQENSVARWAVDEDGDTWQSGNIHVDSDVISPQILVDSSVADSYPVVKIKNDVQNWAIYCDGSQSDALTFYDTTNAVYRFHILNDGQVTIGSAPNANANMTRGLTIDQDGFDDEIIAFKSSDVAHGVTDYTETDTFGWVQKGSGSAGGVLLTGVSEVQYGMVVRSIHTTEDTTKSASGVAGILLDAYLKSGTTIGASGANANLVAIRQSAGTKWICDAEGDTWQSGGITMDDDVLPETTYSVNLGLINKKYLTLHAAELWVETLVAQDTMATIGGRILVGPTTTLTSDLGSGDTTIYVKHNELASGDRVYMEADGNVEFMSIDSAAGGAGPYSYTVTRNLDASGANDWYAGDAVFNTGATGDGFIDLYSLVGVKAGTEVGPTIVGNVRNSATYNDWTEHWAIGNLNGLYGYSADTYGVAFGKFSAADYMTVDSTNGIRFFDSGDAVRAQLTSSVWTLGDTSNEHVRIATTAIQLKDGANVYTDLTAGVLTLGLTSGGEYATIDGTNGIRMYGNAAQRVQIANDGSGWMGASGAFSWDTSGNVALLGLTIGDGTTSGQVSMSHAAAAGDTYIRGKEAAASYDMANWEVDTAAGFILGIDDSDSDKIKFFMGTSGGDYFKFDGTNVTLSCSSADALVIESGGDLTVKSGGDIILESGGDLQLESTGGNTAYISLEGNNRTAKLGMDYDNDRLSLASDTDGVGSWWVGTDPSAGSKRFADIQISAYHATNGQLLLRGYGPSGYYASVDYIGASAGYISMSVNSGGGASNLTMYGDYMDFVGASRFTGGSNKSCDLGISGTAWDDCYADNWNNEPDFPFMDSLDDLAIIDGIKPHATAKCPDTGAPLIDDSTLPRIICKKNKGKYEGVYTDDDDNPIAVKDVWGNTLHTEMKDDVVIARDTGKPWITNKVMFGLLMGAIRQLHAKVRTLETRMP